MAQKFNALILNKILEGEPITDRKYAVWSGEVGIKHLIRNAVCLGVATRELFPNSIVEIEEHEHSRILENSGKCEHAIPKTMECRACRQIAAECATEMAMDEELIKDKEEELVRRSFDIYRVNKPRFLDKPTIGMWVKGDWIIGQVVAEGEDQRGRWADVQATFYDGRLIGSPIAYYEKNPSMVVHDQIEVEGDIKITELHALASDEKVEMDYPKSLDLAAGQGNVKIDMPEIAFVVEGQSEKEVIEAADKIIQMTASEYERLHSRKKEYRRLNDDLVVDEKQCVWYDPVEEDKTKTIDKLVEQPSKAEEPIIPEGGARFFDAHETHGRKRYSKVDPGWNKTRVIRIDENTEIEIRQRSWTD